MVVVSRVSGSGISVDTLASSSSKRRSLWVGLAMFKGASFSEFDDWTSGEVGVETGLYLGTIRDSYCMKVICTILSGNMFLWMCFFIKLTLKIPTNSDLGSSMALEL